jgi:hypothetical protein
MDFERASLLAVSMAVYWGFLMDFLRVFSLVASMAVCWELLKDWERVSLEVAWRAVCWVAKTEICLDSRDSQMEWKMVDDLAGWKVR